jgi:hypothetical protein
MQTPAAVVGLDVKTPITSLANSIPACNPVRSTKVAWFGVRLSGFREPIGLPLVSAKRIVPNHGCGAWAHHVEPCSLLEGETGRPKIDRHGLGAGWDQPRRQHPAGPREVIECFDRGLLLTGT